MDKCLERLMSFRFKLTKRVETAAATKEGCDSEKDSSNEKKTAKKQPKMAKLSTLDPPLRFKEHYLRSGSFGL